jgi:DNA-binding response OmpR family regulator
VPEFTTNEQRILHVLSDGRNHSRQELLLSLDDSADLPALQMYISAIRKKLGLVGQDIKCVLNQGSEAFCHVRLLSKGE